MNEIYRGGVRFCETILDSMSETAIQRAIHEFVNASLVEWTSVVCDLQFSLNRERKKCDLVFVHNTLPIWCAVEVERSEHSLHGHVIPQLSVITSGIPDQITIEAIIQEQSNDERRIHFRSVFRHGTRLVCVAIPFTNDKWLRELRQYQCNVLSIRLFKSVDGANCYFLSGDWDVLTSKFLGIAYRCKSVPSNIRLPLSNLVNRLIAVDLPDRITTEFTVTNTVDQTIITLRNSLQTSKKYHCHINERDNILIIR